MQPDFILYLISQQHLSAQRQRMLAQILAEATTLPSSLIRLEGVGQHLGQALSDIAEGGYRTLLVQPVGIPFSQSLAAWLPGVLAQWLDQNTGLGMTLTLGEDQSESAEVLGVVASNTLASAISAKPISDIKPSLGKPGWQNPPPFRHHILVCTGPRCHFRDAANLKLALAESLTAAGLSSDCLTATTGCLYPCNQGPMLAVYPRGEWYRLVTRPEVDRFVAGVIGKGVTQHDLLIHTVHSIP